MEAIECPVMEGKRCVPLTEAQIDDIAHRAAERAIEMVYTEIGRQVVKRALLLIGAGVLALLAWLGATGKIG